MDRWRRPSHSISLTPVVVHLDTAAAHKRALALTLVRADCHPLGAPSSSITNRTRMCSHSSTYSLKSITPPVDVCMDTGALEAVLSGEYIKAPHGLRATSTDPTLTHPTFKPCRTQLNSPTALTRFPVSILAASLDAAGRRTSLYAPRLFTPWTLPQTQSRADAL